MDSDIRPTRRPEDDPGWALYARTVIRLHRRGHAGVDLDCRRPVTPAIRRALAGIGLPSGFVVLTACHPGGVELSRAECRARTARLACRIRDVARRRPIRADGGSPDRTHVEPGWAAVLPLPTARRLAAEDGQSAIFRFDGQRLWIEPVLVAAAPRALPEGE